MNVVRTYVRRRRRRRTRYVRAFRTRTSTRTYGYGRDTGSSGARDNVGRYAHAVVPIHPPYRTRKDTERTRRGVARRGEANG